MSNPNRELMAQSEKLYPVIEDCDVRAPEKDPSDPLDAADPRASSIPDDEGDEVTYYLSLGSNSDSFA